MAFELYFSISRTAVEAIVAAAIIAGTVYIAKDLIEEMSEDPEEVITTEG